MAERQNKSLQTSFPEEFDTAFYDKDKIEKIVTNILSNAFKYTPENGSVVVSVDFYDEFLRIEVSDSGKGISKEDLKRIFERFYRADLSRNSQGSGLGLSIVKQLVELHGGAVGADYRDNRLGIWFQLPKENLNFSILAISMAPKRVAWVLAYGCTLCCDL